MSTVIGTKSSAVPNGDWSASSCRYSATKKKIEKMPK